MTDPSRRAASAGSTAVDAAAPCPRCGFDIRGLAQTWTTECPLHVTCSECGLEFPTSLAIRSHLFHLPWNVECTSPLSLRWISSVARTTIRCLYPFHFWSTLHMALEYRPRRLFVAILTLAAIALFMFQIGLGAAAYKSHQESLAFLPRFLQVNYGMLNSQLTTYQQRLAQLDPESLDAVQLQTEVKRLQNQLAAIPTTLVVEGSPWQDALHAVAMPWASDPWTTANLPGTRRWTSGPAGVLSRSMSEDSYRGRAILTGAKWSCIFLLVGMPVFLWCLPQSRRRERVLPRHVSRAFAYSVMVTLLFFAGLGLSYAISMLRSATFEPWSASETVVYLWPAWVIWMAVFWTCAIHRYMKMHNALGIVACALFIFLLLTVAVLEEDIIDGLFPTRYP